MKILRNITRPGFGWLLVAAILAIPLLQTSNALNIFLKLDGIDGESTTKGFENEIEVLSWSWGATNSITSGSGAGKASVQDLKITKHIDKATPSLLLNVMNGKHIQDGQLTVSGNTSKGTTYEALKIELKDIIVTSLDTAGSNSETNFTEIITLNFGSYKLTYTPLVNGSPGSSTSMQWNIVNNTPTF